MVSAAAAENPHIKALQERREYLGRRIAVKYSSAPYEVREYEALGWAIARCLWVMREVGSVAPPRPRAPDPDDDGA